MKKRLREDLLDEEIIGLVGYDDDNEPKIYFLYAPGSTKGVYIEYEIYDEVPTYFDEGEERAITYYIQIDIFSPGEYETLENNIKKVLKRKGYCGGYGPDLFEKETKLYHKPLRFTFTKIIRGDDN